MKITNKTESDLQIKKLGLNRMNEGIFSKNQFKEVDDFLNKNQYEYYNIRDKNKVGGRFLYKLTCDEVLTHVGEYEKFSIYESLAEADERLVLQGDIRIDKDFNILATLDNRKKISLRLATQDAKYHINTMSPFYRYRRIYGLDKIIDHISIHKLFNVFVEFSLFEIPVGINHENIIIWEIRNY